MSLALDFSQWPTDVANWLDMINDASHGLLDIMIAFAIAGAAVLVVYRYLQANQS